MARSRVDVLQARLDLVTTSLTALLHVLPPEMAGLVAQNLHQHLSGEPATPSADADEAVAADLGRLMCALLGPPLPGGTLPDTRTGA